MVFSQSHPSLSAGLSDISDHFDIISKPHSRNYWYAAAARQTFYFKLTVWLETQDR